MEIDEDKIDEAVLALFYLLSMLNAELGSEWLASNQPTFLKRA